MVNERKPVPVVRLELKHVDLKELVRIDGLLGEAPLFKAVGRTGVARLIEKASPRRLAAGQAAYRQGEKGNGLFLVLRGEIVLSQNETVVDTVRKGDFFGEAEILDPLAPRGCTAMAADAADVAEFPHAEVASLVRSHVALLALLRDARDARAKAHHELNDFLNRW